MMTHADQLGLVRRVAGQGLGLSHLPCPTHDRIRGQDHRQIGQGMSQHGDRKPAVPLGKLTPCPACARQDHG